MNQMIEFTKYYKFSFIYRYNLLSVVNYLITNILIKNFFKDKTLNLNKYIKQLNNILKLLKT